jgi:uncharacterized surface protein with fasciclin (FAS1) repeats
MRFKLVAVAAAAVGVSVATMACGVSTGAAAISVAGRGKISYSSPRDVLASRVVRRADKRPADSRPGGGRRGGAAARVPGAFGRMFGTGCAQLPRTEGPGSRPGLPRLPVATAMSRVPLLSELSRAIRLAGLTRMLNTAPALTVFAPENAAFQQLGSSNLQALFTTRSDLAPVVKFQIVAGRVRPAELYRQWVLTTIGGTKIYPARAAPSYYVNNGWITCGNLKAANATVYIVNQVLIPAR